MTATLPSIKLKVWADLACFTRPEMKVERVSYPVMTPSAARGVLEAVFWKPEFTWRIEEIWVLKPIRYASLLRNEINTRQSERAARSWQANGGGFDASADRAQRHTLALRDVAYLIHAQVELKPHADADQAKYRDQFRRRVERGRCFSTPYLGCREFSAAFAAPSADEQPIALTDALGPMLLDIEYRAEKPDRGVPRFFDAQLVQGVLHVPACGEA